MIRFIFICLLLASCNTKHKNPGFNKIRFEVDTIYVWDTTYLDITNKIRAKFKQAPIEITSPE